MDVLIKDGANIAADRKAKGLGKHDEMHHGVHVVMNLPGSPHQRKVNDVQFWLRDPGTETLPRVNVGAPDNFGALTWPYGSTAMATPCGSPTERRRTMFRKSCWIAGSYTWVPTWVPRRKTIGYYVHHHGSGHAARAGAIGPHLTAPMVTFGRRPAGFAPAAHVNLPTDEGSEAPPDPTASGAFHWAPLCTETAGRRHASLMAALAEHRPEILVVDVSVEAAVIARLAGIPTIYVRQHGARFDLPHEVAHRSSLLMAPWPIELEHPMTPDWIRERTTYTGFVVGGSEHIRSQTTSADVGVLWGSGGGAPTGGELSILADAIAPGLVQYVGPLPSGSVPTSTRVVVHGWHDDPWSVLHSCSIVVAAAGNNTVAECAASGRGLVVIPEERPFDEQCAHAERLVEAGWAASLTEWPTDATVWSRMLHDARDRAQSLASAPAHGAIRAARHLDSLIAVQPVDGWVEPQQYRSAR